MILLTGALLWLSLRGLEAGEGGNKFDLIWKAWEGSSKTWLLLMVVVAYVSHVMRAERWRMLLNPTGNPVGLGNSFLSLMVGYLVNLAIPRGGEISRCYNLLKLEKTPVEVSFGTVVVERIVDVLSLVLVIALSFVVEWDKLIGFLQSLGIGGGQSTSMQVPGWAFAALAGVVIAGIVLYALRRHPKLLSVIAGFRKGLLSVFQMQNKGLFLFYSIAIWFLYFLMSYCVIMAFDSTRDLGFGAVLTLFALGAIAMAAPLPGGTGSYHTIVPLGLVVLYQLPQAEAIAFVFIFHAWQTITMIVGGVISLVISYFIIRWKERQTR
jgi:glycosyltransferase 2 family protein